MTRSISIYQVSRSRWNDRIDFRLFSSLSFVDIFNKQNNVKETVVHALSTISKEKKTQLLSEEDYFIRKMSGSEYQKNLYDHYRAYNDLLLPNLNVLPKNVKDTLVLFALDNADAVMLNILKQHCCIPCTPNGRTLNKPSKLIHPYCRLASLYSDVDSLFPYGGQDSYLREDRLNVLKLLGELRLVMPNGFALGKIVFQWWRSRSLREKKNARWWGVSRRSSIDLHFVFR